MKLFGYELNKIRKDESSAYSFRTDALDNEIIEIVKSYEWARETLVTEYKAIPPPYDPYLLYSLLTCNGYHSNAIYCKRTATVGQGYDCSDELRNAIDEANEDDSFQDLLDGFSLDLEIYGSAYIEIVNERGPYPYFYHVPALLTRITRPPDERGLQDEGFLQFIYKRGYGLTTVDFPKYRTGMETGMRQLKLDSPGGKFWYGEPEYISAQKSLMLNFSIATLAERWFNNSLMLDKLFTIEGARLTPDQKMELSSFMKRKYHGVDNAAKSLLLELQRGTKLTVADMNTSLKEAPYLDLRRENRDEIASAHRVPPRLLSIISAGQIGAAAEVEGQLKMFKVTFADHRQRKVEQFFRRLFKACNLKGWETFRLIPMDITAGSVDAQTLNLLTGGQPILTPAEARENWFMEKQMQYPGDRRYLTPADAADFVRVLNRINDISRLL